MQAAARGKSVRSKKRFSMRGSSKMTEAETDQAAKDAAATKVQAVARGHKQRKSIAAQVMDRVVDTVEDAVNKVVDVVEDAVEKVVDVVEDAVEKVVDTVEDATYNMVEKLHDVAEDVELDDAAKRIQTMWRGKQARDQVEAIKIEVQMTKSSYVKMKNDTVTRVNDYRIGKKLGQGAYGMVLKGSKDHKDYAIKVLRRSILKRKRMGKGSAFDGVLREIALMKTLTHLNIVQLYEVIDDEQRDELYLVMEFIDGGDLQDPINKKRFVDTDTLRHWLRDTCLGIEYLHLMGICHRDMKPENLLLDAKNNRIKVADFGVSQIANKGRGGDYMKVTGGTPLFFAPEMCGADKTGTNVYSGKAADMWAIGVCIYMWLYHKLPFEAPTQFMLMEAIAAGEITYPEAVEQAPAGFEGHGDALMEVMKGLLEPIAQNRLRVRDLRRHVFLTNYGTEPLGEDGNDENEVMKKFFRTAARAELNDAVGRVVQQNKVADAARMSIRSDTQSTLLDEGSQLAGAEESSVRPGAEGSSDQQ